MGTYFPTSTSDLRKVSSEITLLECSMFDLLSVHSQQHGRHTTTSQELTQTRHRYVHVSPPSIVAFQRRRHASNRRARQSTQRSKTFPTRSVSYFSPPFSRSFCESPSALVSTLQTSKKQLREQRRLSEHLLANHLRVLLADLSKALFPSANSGKLFVNL